MAEQGCEDLSRPVSDLKRTRPGTAAGRRNRQRRSAGRSGKRQRDHRRAPEGRPQGARGVVKGLREPARPPAFHAGRLPRTRQALRRCDARTGVDDTRSDEGPHGQPDGFGNAEAGAGGQRHCVEKPHRHHRDRYCPRHPRDLSGREPVGFPERLRSRYRHSAPTGAPARCGNVATWSGRSRMPSALYTVVTIK